MRVPITFDQPLGVLIDSLPQRGTRRRVIETIISSFLWEDPSSYRDAIATATSAETRAILSDVKDRICWKKIDNDPSALQVTVADRNLSEILDSDEVVEAIQSISSPIHSGQLRQDGFDSKFGNLLAKATRIEVIDAYAASNLMILGEGTSWFLNEAFKKFNGVISIISEEPREIRNGPAGVTAKRELVISNLKQLLKDAHAFKGEVRVTLVDASLVPHNRRLGFRFDSGQATVVLEKGLGIFDFDPFNESHELANADLQEFKKVFSTAFSSTKKYEIVLNHESSCATCMN